MYLGRHKDPFQVLAKCEQIHSVYSESVHRSFSIPLENVHRYIPCTWKDADPFHVLAECTQIHPFTWRVCKHPFPVFGDCAQIHSMYLKSVHGTIPCTWKVCPALFHAFGEWAQIHSMLLESVHRPFHVHDKGAKIHAMYSIRQKNVHFFQIIRFFKFQPVRFLDDFRSVLKLCS